MSSWHGTLCKAVFCAAANLCSACVDQVAPVQVVEEARQPPRHHVVVVPPPVQLSEQLLVPLVP